MSLSSVNDYDIGFELRPDYLLVRVTLTKNDYNTARQYWTKVLREVHRRRCSRVIVDISAPIVLAPEDAHSLMSDFSKLFYPGIKVAIVNKNVVRAVRAAVESTATIRGRSVMVFDDISSAEAWLEEENLNFAPAALKSEVQDLTSRDTMH